MISFSSELVNRLLENYKMIRFRYLVTYTIQIDSNTKTNKTLIISVLCDRRGGGVTSSSSPARAINVLRMQLRLSRR